MGPFHVLSWSLPVHRFFPDAGVTAYTIDSHAAPPHGESHVHAPALQTPLSEQSKSVAHACAAATASEASATARDMV